MTGNRMTARAFLARELRRAREAKQISRESLAKVVYASESLVAAWETGRRVPKPEYVDRVIDVLGLDGLVKRMIDDLVTNEGGPEWLGKWIEVEQQATSLLWFETTVIPGLLQTEEYARAILQAGRHRAADTEDMVSLRLERQLILDGDNPPVLVALMDESILRRNVGGAKVMHGQLMRLIELGERQEVIIHVVPLASPVCAGFIGHFVLASLNGGAEVAYVDNQLSGEVVEGAEDVAALRRMFEVFRSGALFKEESIELIRRTAKQ